MPFSSALRSLSHRNYRLFFAGQGISLIGTWMQQVAMSWLVFQMTGSSFKLGLVLFCSQIPGLFLSPIAGVVVDKVNRHKLLILTQSLAMLQAFVLTFLALTSVISVNEVLGLSLFLGVINAFDVTTRQAFLSEMVTNREDLSNAIALNSSLMNGARLVGPSLAGFVLALSGPSVCFMLNGVSYIAVLLALRAMRVTPRPHVAGGSSLRAELAEGVRYAFGFMPIRVVLLALCVASMVGSSYNVILPEFAVNYLHGGAGTLGILSSAAGAGALCGAIFLAMRKSVVGLGKWVWIGLALMGCGLTAFALAGAIYAAMPALFITGFGLMVQMASSNTILQTIVEEDKRGRVMSFFAMAFLGMAPVGSLVTGYLATLIGIAPTVVLNGTVCMATALWFHRKLPAMRELVRPIYVKLNIVSPVDIGIETASELKLMTK